MRSVSIKFSVSLRAVDCMKLRTARTCCANRCAGVPFFCSPMQVFFGHFYIDTRIARMFLSLRMLDLWPSLPDEMYNQKTATKKAFYLHFLRYDALNSSTENEITRYMYIVQQNGLFTVRSSEMCHQPEHMLLPLVCL